MKNKIRRWVFGWLAGVYGLTASVVSGVRTVVISGRTILGGTPTTADATADVLIAPTATTQTNLVLQRIASQSVNMFELQAANGTVQMSINSDGNSLSMSEVAARIAIARSTGGNALDTRVIGDSDPRIVLRSEGHLQLGLGSATPGTGLQAVAAGVLKVTDGSTGGGWLQVPPGRSRVANDVTNITITPAAITGLSATLIAGRKYSGRLVLFINNALADDGLRLDFDGGTATMTSFRAGFEAGANVTTFGVMNSSALATDLTIDAFSGTGDSVVVVSFSLVCNVAGTFIPRIAKEADAAGATLTVYTNSFMWLEDMP